MSKTVFYIGDNKAHIITTRKRVDGLHDTVSVEVMAFNSKADAIKHARQIGAAFTS